MARRFVRPQLARTSDPDTARAAFDRAAPRLLRAPPYLRHLVRRTSGAELHWIGVGRSRPGVAVFYIHGGAFVAGSPVTHAAMLGRISKLSGVEVCAPRYRLLQEAPFPAAPDDARAAWAALMALGYRPEDVVIGGDSAGGGLALGLLARLLAEGQRPAGLFALSPWTDLTLSGESLATLGPRDPVLPVERMAEVRDLYLAGADPADPRASPLFAHFPGAPPVLIQVGAEEALLSDSQRIAERLRAEGGAVDLDPWPGCLHVWQMGDGWLPESRAALRKVAQFIQDSLASVSR